MPRFALLVCALTIVGAACGDTATSTTTSQHASERNPRCVEQVSTGGADMPVAQFTEVLQQHRERWQVLQIVDYKMIYLPGGGLLQPQDVLVTVSGGEVTGVERASDHARKTEPVVYTVEELFAFTDRVLAYGQCGDEDLRRLNVGVGFDSSTGRITRVFVDNERAMDDEFGITVTRFARTD